MKGEYGAVYTAIVDDPEFQALSPDARLLWFVLRMLLGASGIDLLRAHEAALVPPTGMTVDRIAAAKLELVEGDWLEIECDVLWLRNALRFNPNMSPEKNRNHASAIEGHLDGLPRLAIVRRFAEYYGLTPENYPYGDGIPHPIPHPIGEQDIGHTTYDNPTYDKPTGVAHAREREPMADPMPEDLDTWLGDLAPVLDDCPFLPPGRQRNQLYQQLGPPGLHAAAWRRDDGTTLPEADRPRLLAVALSSYAAEGKRSLVLREFAGLLRGVIRDENKPPPGSEGASWDSSREQSHYADHRSQSRPSTGPVRPDIPTCEDCSGPLIHGECPACGASGEAA